MPENYSTRGCFTDRINDPTNLKDFYPQAQKLPPLLICNQKRAERVQDKLLQSSVLLQGEKIDCSNLNKDRNNEIYKRNLPSESLGVNIDMRPVSSSKCADNRFIKDRNKLETYNEYIVNLECVKNKFNPGKGNHK